MTATAKKQTTSAKESAPIGTQTPYGFKVVAILLPFLLLITIECLLRLFHYGHDTSLFIPYPDDTSKLVMNRYASEPYFSDTLNATRGYIEPFDKIKKPGTLRIFVLGESTTEGYPYFHNGSFHRWLQYRLMNTLPNTRVEVINVSLTAVNSYTVLDFGKEVAKYQPDAVLMYVGHNEYYGALGVGSTSNIGSNRFLIKTLLVLKRSRLVQLCNNFISGIRGSMGHTRSANQENLMERMAAKQELPFGSADYQKGISQFEENIGDLCRFYSTTRIPVFISTVVSNEKDLKPFISSSTGASAKASYQLAEKAYQAQNYAEAKKDYVKAKELDMLRFRAPEAINNTIRRFATTYPNIHLVDTRAVFENHSPHGILGNETLLEHVHPNLYGYALMSDAFYEALKKYHIIVLQQADEMTFNQLLTQMPVTKVDSLNGAYQIMMLKAGWPFNEKIPASFKAGSSLAEKLAGPLAVNRITWMQAMDELFKQSMAVHDNREALKATEAVLLEHPAALKDYIFAARLNYELKNMKRSEFYFKKCYQLDASTQNAQNLVLFYVKTDDLANALKYADLVGPNAESCHRVVQDLANNKKQLAMNTANMDARARISADYKLLGQDSLATVYARR